MNIVEEFTVLTNGLIIDKRIERYISFRLSIGDKKENIARYIVDNIHNRKTNIRLYGRISINGISKLRYEFFGSVMPYEDYVSRYIEDEDKSKEESIRFYRGRSFSLDLFCEPEEESIKELMSRVSYLFNQAREQFDKPLKDYTMRLW